MKKYYCALGSHQNLPTHLQHFEEVAYSLADKGYTLRTIPTQGASQSFIKGVQRFCSKRKKNISEYIEVYLPLQTYKGYYSEQVGFFNIQNFNNSDMIERLVEQFSNHVILGDAEKRLTRAVPYMVLGSELKTPVSFFITDILLYDLDNEGNISDGQGIAGQAIRMLRTLSPKTQIFNFEHEEHKKRINSLIYYAKK